MAVVVRSVFEGAAPAFDVMPTIALSTPIANVAVAVPCLFDNDAGPTASVIRCHGATRDGFPCRWTSQSLEPAASPLRAGGRFCLYHMPRRVTPTPEDTRQPRLERFFAPPGTVTLMPTSAQIDLPAALTQEQSDRIAENRRRALERRASKTLTNGAETAAQAVENASSVASVTAMQHSSQVQALSQSDTSTKDCPLTQEQRDRIDNNRRRALQRRASNTITASEKLSERAPVTRSPTTDAVPSCPVPQTSLSLSTEQEVRIVENRRLASEKKQRKQFAMGYPDSQASATGGTDCGEEEEGCESLQNVRHELTAAQVERIAQNRLKALERRNRERVASSLAFASEDTPVPSGGAPQMAMHEVLLDRSKTPPRRRRCLTTQLTGSPMLCPRAGHAVPLSSCSLIKPGLRSAAASPRR